MMTALPDHPVIRAMERYGHVPEPDIVAICSNYGEHIYGERGYARDIDGRPLCKECTDAVIMAVIKQGFASPVYREIVEAVGLTPVMPGR